MNWFRVLSPSARWLSSYFKTAGKRRAFDLFTEIFRASNWVQNVRVKFLTTTIWGDDDDSKNGCYFNSSTIKVLLATYFLCHNVWNKTNIFNNLLKTVYWKIFFHSSDDNRYKSKANKYSTNVPLRAKSWRLVVVEANRIHTYGYTPTQHGTNI